MVIHVLPIKKRKAVARRPLFIQEAASADSVEVRRTCPVAACRRMLEADGADRDDQDGPFFRKQS